MSFFTIKSSILFVIFVAVFTFAVGYMLFYFICNIRSSRKDKGKKPSFIPHSEYDSTIHNSQNDTFFRQAQAMHDQALHQHMADHNSFMNHSISMHNDNFMNNMNNFM